LFFNSLLSIILQHVSGRYILLDINSAVEKEVESRAGNVRKPGTASTEDFKCIYRETTKKCLRKNDISDACVEFINTGKMKKRCKESCAKPECFEKLEQCLLQLKDLKEVQRQIQFYNRLDLSYSIMEVMYDGAIDKLKDKFALGSYKFLAVSNINKSPVYVNEDEVHSVTEAPGSRSFIFRNWDDDKWIGTRSLEDTKRNDDNYKWLTSDCKEYDLVDCRPDDWKIQTRDPKTQNKAWDEGNVSIYFTDSILPM